MKTGSAVSLIYAKYTSQLNAGLKQKTHPISFKVKERVRSFFLLRRHHTQKSRFLSRFATFFEKFTSWVQLVRIILYRGSCKVPFAVVIRKNRAQEKPYQA